MSEISSPKLLEIKLDTTGANNAGFNRVLTGKETAPEKESQIRFTNPDMFTAESAQKNIPQNTSNQSPTLLLMSSIYSKMVDPFVRIQQKVDINKQLFIDITDKLAAIYGEKEKDIKDKLSDVFKKLILRPFNLISEVDTSMEQKEHNKEKKLRDRKSEKQNNKVEIDKKMFSLRQWINYKLLEIAGEILNLSRKFSAGIKNKHKKFKKGVYKNFKKIKKNTIFLFDNIDSLFEATKKNQKEPEIDNFLTLDINLFSDILKRKKAIKFDFPEKNSNSDKEN